MATGPDLSFDDLEPGWRWDSGPVLIERDAMRAFAELYDPQPIHLEREAAVAAGFADIIASGLYTLAVLMRQFVEGRPFGATPIVGVGVDDLRWRFPTFAGDVLQPTREVVELQPHPAGKPFGTVLMRTIVRNEAGREVNSFVTRTRMPRRP